MALTFKAEPLAGNSYQIVDPVVIFPRSDGGICLITAFHSDAVLPEDADALAFVMRRARLDVPRGRPFRLVQAAVIPDRTFREAWVADFSAPDGVGGENGRQDWDETVGMIFPWPKEPRLAASALGACEIHMPRARLCHKQRMRARRSELWPSIDAARGIALDSKDAAALDAIALRAQALRDVTAHPDIEAAKTPEELKAVWPECLK